MARKGEHVVVGAAAGVAVYSLLSWMDRRDDNTRSPRLGDGRWYIPPPAGQEREAPQERTKA